MTATSYTIGLPVTITVNDDGSVEFEVDLSEADDLFEGVPTDDDGEPIYPEAVIEADRIHVSQAAASLGHTIRPTTVFPTA